MFRFSVAKRTNQIKQCRRDRSDLAVFRKITKQFVNVARQALSGSFSLIIGLESDRKSIIKAVLI